MASSDNSTPDGHKDNQKQEAEIKELKSIYGDACRVIGRIGDFSNVITVRKDGSQLVLKFQLEERYPTLLPNIIVKNAGLDAAQIAKLDSNLSKMASSLRGEAMLRKLIEYAWEWCEDKECVELQSESPRKSSKQKTKKQQKSKAEKDETKSTKLPSMKTAEDVIARIMWDDSIPTECFSVGYLDRFVGIVERQFMEFSWEDLASVDYDTLAIPKHRIQYFKYKDQIVWDKSSRMDNFFGSTGSGLKIQDIIETFDQNKTAHAENVVNDKCSHSDSESDDEDVVINVNGSDDDTGAPQYERDKYWGPKKRPTYFLCLRVQDPEIVATMKDVHRQITEYESTYEDSLIPAEKLHMTLACLGLDDDFEVEKTSDFLREIQPDLERLRPRDIEVEFSGVDNFFHNVMYAKVKENEDLHNFVQNLQDKLDEAGIEVRDVFDFVPHMTILKFKKHHQAMAHTRYIDSKLYDMFVDTKFGVQSFDNIHLCKMTTEAADGGFYICPRKIHFTSKLK